DHRQRIGHQGAGTRGLDRWRWWRWQWRCDPGRRRHHRQLLLHARAAGSGGRHAPDVRERRRRCAPHRHRRRARSQRTSAVRQRRAGERRRNRAGHRHREAEAGRLRVLLPGPHPDARDVAGRRVTRRRALVALVGISASVAPVARAAAPAPPKATCAAPAAPRGEWRSYGHDYFNSRFQDAEHDIGPLEAATPGPEWTFSSHSAGGEGDFTGTPAIADGCLFVASNRGWVFALNADTGKVVWKTKLPSGGVDSSVTVSDGRVLAEVSDPGRPYLVSLDEATGASNL